MNESFEDLGILDMKLGVGQHRVCNAEETDDFLAHYGIKGQKHGVRRYQYEDGSYTPEGKERYASDSGGIRGRRRTSNMTQGSDVHKTESVNQGKAPQMTQSVMQSSKPQNHADLMTKKTNMMSDDEYSKAKQEFAKRDFVQVYDGHAGTMIYVKKDKFRDHIRSLVRQGIEVKMPYLDSNDTSSENMDDIRTKNAEVRYWNELAEKAQSQTYSGPESEGLLTDNDKKEIRQKIANRRAAIEAERKKAKLEEHRKKNPALMQLDEDEDSLQHYGILGMKWGIRRYQNKDGSLTAAGRKRYGDDIPDGNKPSSGNSSDATPRTPAKSASEMTDQELNQALNRLRMEQQYNELTGAKSSNQYQNQQNFQNPPSNTGNLSNAELQAYINRLDMEKRYAQLTAPPAKELTTGQKFVRDVIGPALNQVAKAFIVDKLSKALGIKGDGDGGGNNNSSKNKNNDGGKKDKDNYTKWFNETDKNMNILRKSIDEISDHQKKIEKTIGGMNASKADAEKEKKAARSDSAESEKPSRFTTLEGLNKAIDFAETMRSAMPNATTKEAREAQQRVDNALSDYYSQKASMLTEKYKDRGTKIEYIGD